MFFRAHTSHIYLHMYVRSLQASLRALHIIQANLYPYIGEPQHMSNVPSTQVVVITTIQAAPSSGSANSLFSVGDIFCELFGSFFHLLDGVLEFGEERTKLGFVTFEAGAVGHCLLEQRLES